MPQPKTSCQQHTDDPRSWKKKGSHSRQVANIRRYHASERHHVTLASDPEHVREFTFKLGQYVPSADVPPELAYFVTVYV